MTKRKDKVNLLSIFLLFLLAFGPAKAAFASQLPVNGGRITSDFGPRWIASDPWHRGIDYATPAGEKIYAVEAGNLQDVIIVTSINQPNPEHGYGNRVIIRSGNRIYFYCHLYGGRYADAEGGWELTTDDGTKKGKPIIVFYNSSGKVIRVLARQADLPLIYEGVSATSYVAEGEYFARVGNTGFSTGPHLHLGLNDIISISNADNPLAVLPYRNGNSPSITVTSPPNGAPYTTPKLSGNVLVRAKVDTTNDYDLNKVKLYVDGTLARDFSYGGREGEAELNTNVVFNRNSNGVYPEALGKDEFIYQLDTRKYSNGSHTLKIAAADVLTDPNNGSFTEALVPVEIHNGPLQLVSKNIIDSISSTLHGQSVPDSVRIQSLSGVAGLSSGNVTAFTTSGDGDGIIEPGEIIGLTLTLQNNGSTNVGNVNANLETATGYSDVDVLVGSQLYGDISASSQVANLGKFEFKVPSNYLRNEIWFNLKLNYIFDGASSADTISFALPVGSSGGEGFEHLPSIDDLGRTDFTVIGYGIDDNEDDDSDGNGNGIVDVGDKKVNMYFVIANVGSNPGSPSIRITPYGSKIFDSYFEGKKGTADKDTLQVDSISFGSSQLVKYTLELQDDFDGGPISFRVYIYASSIEYQDLYITLPSALILTSVQPENAISPNGDRYKDELTFKWKVETKRGTIDRIIMAYRDVAGGNWQYYGPLDVFISEDDLFEYGKEYTHSWNWSGVSNGVYDWSLMALGPIKIPYYAVKAYSLPKRIVIAREGPVITNFGISPLTFSNQSYMAENRFANIAFNLSKPSNVTINVNNTLGQHVKTIIGNILLASGDQNYFWDGRDDADVIVADGIYKISVFADDNANPVVAVTSESITVDNPPQDFYLLTSTTEVISPTKDYALSWTSASLHYGPTWNHLKEYQVLGRKLDWKEGEYGVLVNRIRPDATSTTVNLMVDDTWQIKVRAIDEEGNWCDSDGTNSAGYAGDPKRLITVKVDSTPPNIFTISYPWYDGQKFDAKDVRIAWEEALDANLDHYELVVGTDPNDIHGSAIFSAEIPATATREVWLRNLQRGRYYIYMIAYDKAGHWRRLDGKTDVPEWDHDLTYAWDGKWPAFEVGTIPPLTFSLGQPYDGQYFDGRKVTITWNEPYDRNLDYYKLVIGTNPDNIQGTAVYSATFEAGVTSCEVTLPGGIYYIYLVAYDEDGNWRDLKGKTNVPEYDEIVLTSWPMFEIDHEPPEVTYDPTAYPPATNPHFSPNGDGKKDSTVINYYVGDDSYWKVDYLRMNEVTIEVKGEIVNSSGEVVRSWSHRSPPGWYEFTWDGTKDDGRGTRDDTYTVRITATDRALNTATDESLSLVVDTTPPTITNLANSGIFSPNGDGKFDTDTLTFDLNDNLSSGVALTVEVINASGTHPLDPPLLLREGETPTKVGEGVSLIWNGKTNDGRQVEDGPYHYRITATDQAGNSLTLDPCPLTLIVDTTPPAITNVSTNPKSEVTFTNTTGRLDFSFQVSELANVGLTICDSNHAMLYDALVTAEPGSTQTISWNGKDTFGEFVADNTYINYTFTATDRAANSSVYRPIQVVKVNTPVTGLAGNIIYSQDGMVKVIIPAGAVPERAELYLDDYDTSPKSYQVNGKDNITLTYKLAARGSTDEVIFKKTPVLVMQYDPRVLNFENQTVELWRRGSGWTRLFGSNTSSNVYAAYIDKTSDFALFADLTPPTSPVIDQPDSPTRDRKITITGTSEPFSKVDLWINGLLRSPPIEVGAAGVFTADLVLSEGINTIQARATDQTGNAGATSEAISVELDTTPPNITLLSPQTIYTNGGATISCSAEDAVTIIISVRDSAGKVILSANNSELTVGSSLLSAQGTYPYLIKAFDALGNEARKQGQIIVDRTLPEAYLYAEPITYTISGNLALFGIAEDANFESYLLEYGAGENPSSWVEIQRGVIPVNYQKFIDFDTRILTDGVYTFRLTSRDKAGNTRSYSLRKLVINADLSGTIFYPTMNQVVNGTIEVRGEIHGENFAEYRVEYGVGTSPSSWIQIYRSTTLPTDSVLANWNTHQVPDGAYTIRLNVINIGNRSTYYTVPVVVDNGNPGISITSPVSNAVLGGTIEVDATITDANFSYYKVEYASSSDPNNWQTIQGPSYTISHPLAAWNTAGLNGDYTIKVTVVDVVNNSSSGVVIITVDNITPEANILYPTASQVVNKTIQIKGTADDLHFASYKLEYSQGGPWTGFASSTTSVRSDTLGSLDTTTLADGPCTVKLTATDQAGNQSESRVNFVIDNTSPTALIAFPTTNLVIADTVSILGTAIDEAHFKEYKVEYGQGESPTSWAQIGSTHSSSVFGSTLESWDTTQVADGIYTLKLTVKDIVDNTSTSEVRVIVDNTYPTVDITAPTSGSYLAGTVNISGTISDANLNSILVEYREAASPESWQAISALDPVNILNSTIYNWSASTLNGDYVIRVKATDKTGKTTTDEVQVRLDNIPPVINITSPSRESVNTGMVDILGEISDLNIDHYTIKYGYGIEPTRWFDLTSGSSSIVSPPSSIVTWNTPNVKDGYYTLKFDATDKAGNSTSREFVITIDNAPAVAKIHSPVADQVVKGVVSIEGIACDADFTTYNFKGYEINVGTGLVPVRWTTIESLVVPKINEVLTDWNTVGLADGTYTLKLRAQDINGITEDTKTVIVDNTPPVASITSPSQGQTVSGNVDIIGTASDTNFSEYKVYYKPSDSTTWTLLISRPSSIVSSSLVSWDTTQHGDGSYQVKLWVKDKAGNESEVIRDITVNNVLAVVNDSASPATISPNGDGIDDIARINYTLSETSPVTVKIYKKPQYDKFIWEAKGFGTRYPRQDFTYTISASGTDHPVQNFDYTLTASGTRYPPQTFTWRVDASGVETWSQSGTSSLTNQNVKYSERNWGIDMNGDGVPGIYRAEVIRFNYVVTYPEAFVHTVIPSGNFYFEDTATECTNVGFTGHVDTFHNIYWIGGSQDGHGPNGWSATWWPRDTSYQINWSASDNDNVSASDPPPPSNSNSATIDRNGSITGNSYSVTLSPIHGGTISGHNISYSQTSNTTGVSSWRDSSGWSGNTCSGVIEARYIYSGDPWSKTSGTQSGQCDSRATGGYKSSFKANAIRPLDDYVEGATWSLSAPTDPDVSLRFEDGTTSTSNGNQYIVASTTVTAPWSATSNPSGFCNSGPGSPTNYSKPISQLLSSPPSTADGLSYRLSNLSNNKVWLRFSDTNSSTTTNPNASVIASTSYTEPWDTSLAGTPFDSSGWKRSGEISLPFNYDESSQSFSVDYTPWSDVTLNSWTVNLKNPAGGTSTDVRLDGTPTASGSFKVKIADNLLVKTLQYNALTPPGARSIEWDGTKDPGSQIPDTGGYVEDGDYIYVIYAGPNIVKKSGVIRVRRSSEITSASLSEEYISPNGDGIKDTTTISYTLTENASVVIEVLSRDGSVVKSFTASGNRGPNTSSWDGRDGSGAIVEDGEYTIRIKATHSNGTLRTKELKVVVDNNSLTAPTEPARKLVTFAEDPTYSPDKTKITYVKDVSGKKQIFVMNLLTTNNLQLTTYGNNTQPVWSSDGSKIAFTSDRTGNNDIWIMNSDGSSQKQITSDNASETSPAFSPDGQKIAYASNRTGELDVNKWNIWMVGIDGKNPTQLTKDENTAKDDFPAWSPDGKKLAFASDQSGNFDIWTIDKDGSVKTQITSSFEVETKPSWSPDGLKIAYAKENGIYIRKVSDGEEIQISSGADDSNPSWSRDGTEIVYNTASGDIYAKKVYTGALTGVITRPILNQTLSGLVEIRGTALDTNFESYKLEFSPNSLPYSWTAINNSNTPITNGILGTWNTASVPDGEYTLRLTVNDKAGNSLQNTVAVSVDNDNWKLTISSLSQLTSSDAWDIEPAWSPDGSKLAFSSNRSGSYDIWIMNADGTGLQNLTNNPAYDGKPVWSPDGTKIAFVSDRSGNKDIWVMNADGSGTPLQLTNLTIIDTDPTWSPDGSKIAFASNRSGNFDIWLMNSDGTGSPVKLTSSEADDREPSWSQFGIAYTSDRSGNKEVWMIEDVNNPNPFRLTSSEAEDKEPCWAPIAIPLSDGSSRSLITFTSNRNGNYDIFVMDTDGIDQSKALTDYTNVDCNPSWSPDGRKVAYASYKDGQYDIWVMNFGINTTALSIRAQQLATTEIQLISPKDEERVQTLRPTFQWKAPKGTFEKYKVKLKEFGGWEEPKWSPIFNTKGIENSKEPGVLFFGYKLDDIFDDPLKRGSYEWKVAGVKADGSEIESSTESFTIEPDFTIDKVTNFPNPFNPNNGETTIRYRLSRNADEVKIRIYDITGALVVELDGTTVGEGQDRWVNKYNDVRWNGRNGRGDVVMNGIYPFEVVARSGDKVVSGRGKIAVLK